MEHVPASGEKTVRRKYRRKVKTLTLDKEIIGRLLEEAKRSGRPQNEIVEAALTAYFNQIQPEKN